MVWNSNLEAATFGTQSFFMLPSCGIFAQTQPLGAPSGSPNSYLRSFTLRFDNSVLMKTSLLDDLLWVVGLVAVDHLEGLHLGDVEHGERVRVGVDVQNSYEALRNFTMRCGDSD